MSEKYLHRDDAPFSEQIWEKIDHTAVHAASAQLSGRRILDIEGPFGYGLKIVPDRDVTPEDPKPLEGVELATTSSIPVTVIRSKFKLAARDIATYEQCGLGFDATAIACAAMGVARQEDALIFHGGPGTAGLLKADGVQRFGLSSWDTIGTAADNIINAVTMLDKQGFHGPFTLALAPNLYNALYRRYPQGNATELRHISEIVTDGIIKAPALESGGVLRASGQQFASIVIGQDMVTGFIGPDDGHYEFTIFESLALKVRMPSSICILEHR